ncbi:hypothetical protein [Paenibacillus humicus]|uniref:hypothetical protein n=1 Tax=Paenibacillus humicus TaxID=412861 RepID=UPI000FD8C885|nr:hypothetical protein [Paenibacillus humicus]
MKKPLLLLAGMLFVLLPLQPSQVQALSCAEPRSMEEAYIYYDAILEGHLDKSVSHFNRNELRITVKTSYKGVGEERIIADEDKFWGVVNGPSASGEDYLFFLKIKGDHWENPLCAPSRPVAESAAALAYLKGKEIPLQRAAEPAAQDTAWKNLIQAQGSLTVAGLILAAAALGALGLAAVLRRRRRR